MTFRNELIDSCEAFQGVMRNNKKTNVVCLYASTKCVTMSTLHDTQNDIPKNVANQHQYNTHTPIVIEQ